MNEIDPSQGLHRIKDTFQKTHLVQQCENLIQNLDEAIDATLAAAPLRTPEQGFLLDHSGARDPQLSEGQLERQLHARWSADGCDPVAECWVRLVAFQVSLPNVREATGWGEIDLLGASETGLPIVIELKQGAADDTPAKLVVQAAAYALALQKAWPHLRGEWRRAVSTWHDPPLPTALLPCHAICLAPSSYWDLWRGDHPRAQTVRPGTWTAVRRLIDALHARGIVVRTATIDGVDDTLTVSCFDLPTDFNS